MAPALPQFDEDYELPPWSRTLCGYHERYSQPFILPLPGGGELRLAQAPRVSAAHSAEAKGSADGLCTGATVWDAGVVLAAHLLLPRPAGAARGGTCLDLGSGTGIVGLGCWRKAQPSLC